MFCEKCGAQLPDTANFCNKCGNTLRRNTGKKQVSIPKVPKGVILAAAVIIIAVVAFSIIKKPSLYGTWTDAGNTMTFTFAKDGSLRIAGAKNVLGADAFQFTKKAIYSICRRREDWRV